MMKIASLAVALTSIVFAAPASAQSNAGPPKLADIPGFYECRTGAITAIVVNKDPTVVKFDAATPLLRIEIGQSAAGARVDVRPWDPSLKAWRPASTSDSLVVLRTALFSDGWGLTFEGVIGNSPSTTSFLRAFLGQGTGAALLVGAPPDKPVLTFTTLSDFRGASAGAAVCEKVAA